MEIYLFILLAMGFLLMGLEIFLPGGVAGVLGGLCLIVGVALTFRTYGTGMGICALLICLAVGSALGILGWKGLESSALVLRSRLGNGSAQGKGEEMKGKVGVALTDLRPSGGVEIEGRSVDAITEGEYIARGTRIEVVEGREDRVLVRPFQQKG